MVGEAVAGVCVVGGPRHRHDRSALMAYPVAPVRGAFGDVRLPLLDQGLCPEAAADRLGVDYRAVAVQQLQHIAPNDRLFSPARQRRLGHQPHRPQRGLAAGTAMRTLKDLHHAHGAAVEAQPCAALGQNPVGAAACAGRHNTRLAARRSVRGPGVAPLFSVRLRPSQRARAVRRLPSGGTCTIAARGPATRHQHQRRDRRQRRGAHRQGACAGPAPAGHAAGHELSLTIVTSAVSHWWNRPLASNLSTQESGCAGCTRFAPGCATDRHPTGWLPQREAPI